MVIVIATTPLFSQGIREDYHNPKTITLLATKDFPAEIVGYYYENDKTSKNTGLSKVNTYVEKVRKENSGDVVLVDNGN
ncbi:MAG: hypothetical protein JJE21_06925 [Spirochaetaceae bacterium]|nr:hypothetical protein [Spirochaetaceae bacterium]